MTKLKEIEGYKEKRTLVDRSAQGCLYDSGYNEAIGTCGELEIKWNINAMAKEVRNAGYCVAENRSHTIAEAIAKNIGKFIKLKEQGK